MNTDDVIRAVIDSLNQQGVPYMIVGHGTTQLLDRLRNECARD
jgi:hypothetical protein